MQSGLLPTVSIHCHFDNFQVAGALADPSATERTAPNAQSSGHHILESPSNLLSTLQEGSQVLHRHLETLWGAKIMTT